MNKRTRGINWLLARWRWLLFAALFAIAYMYLLPAPSKAHLRDLAIVAAAYNVIATALAAYDMFPSWLPVATTVLDALFIAALVSITGRIESPLLLFLLIPASIAAFRFRWKGLLIAVLAVASFWTYLLAPSFRTMSPGDIAIPLGSKLLLLLCLTISASLLAQAEHAQARQREEKAEERFRLAREQVKAIYELTGNLTATLNYERVLESLLDIGLMGLQEIDRQPEQHVGAVLLFTDTERGRQLRIAEYRRLTESDAQQLLTGETGVLGEVLTAIEPAIINDPTKDPELQALSSLRDCRCVAVIPLRAGFDLYGAVLFASKRPEAYQEDQIAFLSMLCNQATIALQNAQLYQKLEEERDRIIGSEEELRHWLARELHDGPTQTISALAMRLNYARMVLEREPEKAKAELADLEKLARHATREIRTTLFKLRPVALETQGLRAALEQYAARLQETGGPPMQLHIEEPPTRLEPNVETTVFAIVEEAINNARKHADASLITVRVAPYRDLLVVTVHDNGKGFDVKAVERSYDQRGSLGLLNMRERAELIGGKLELDSKPGQGTTVTLAVPLRKTSTPESTP